jgi:hypothetical protein
MTGTSGLSTGHVCILGGWAGTPSFGETLGYRRLAIPPSLYASGALRQETACRQAVVYSRLRRRHTVPYGAGQLQWLASML